MPSRIDVEFVAVGNNKKSRGGATADRRAPTTGIQHKYDQTTVCWREIQVVRCRPTQAIGRLHTEGKEETGVDRRLPECASWDQIESTWCR